jgi:glycine/D-amino acid oxidase-like deaminating enzyme
MKIAERRVAQWSARGAPAELLSAGQVEAITGSRMWHGGWTNPTGGHVNPLALARGLARRVTELGGRVFSETPATAYRHRKGMWQVSTSRGTVTASALVLATNAYTGEMAPGLAPAIARQVVPVLSWQMATRPLGDNVRRNVIPQRQALSDTHGELHFARYDARHRLVTGGAAMVSANAAPRLRVRIGTRLQRMFEHLGEVQFDYVWNGYLGMTADYMPRVHRLGPDGYAWVGCNGRGVALSIAMGREMARAVCGTPVTELAMPLSAPAPLPLHSVVRRLAPLRLLEYRWRDAREI